MEMSSKIEAAVFKLDTKLTSEIKQASVNTQKIALGTGYACLKAVTGEKKLVPTWISKIDACVQSQGTDCQGVIDIPTAHATPNPITK